MPSMLLNRAGAQGLRSAARVQQMRGAATLAAFRTPKVFNEPNVCRIPLYLGEWPRTWKDKKADVAIHSNTLPRTANSALA